MIVWGVIGVTRRQGDPMEWDCGNVQGGGGMVLHHVHYEVGDGSKVLFWHDVWCGELPLKVLFPELFIIACGKDAWVEENMQFQNGNVHWNVLLFRHVHNWEVDVVS